MKQLGIRLFTLVLLVGLVTPAWAVNAVPALSDGDNSGLQDMKDYHYQEAYARALDEQYEKGYQEGYADAQQGTWSPKESDDEDDLFLSWLSGYEEGYQTGVLDMEYREAITKVGGTPDQINLRLNDKCVVFTDAFPEVKDGRTMVPLRAVMEALDATLVLSENNRVTIQAKTCVLTMEIGSKTVTVERDGKTETVTMDIVPYLKNDRTYVPLRFFAEVLGYVVDWDPTYRCVVVLDRDKLQSDLDARFGILNKLLRQKAQPEGNRKRDGSFSIQVELIDSIDGNKTYPVSGQFSLHTGASALSLDLGLDLSALFPLMESVLKNGTAWYGELWEENVSLYKTLLAKQSFVFKQQPSGQLYVKSSMLDAMRKAEYGTAFDSTKDTWYDLGKNDLLAMLQTGQMSAIGAMLYADYEWQRDFVGPFEAYDQILRQATDLETILGDKTFQKQGDGYVWTLDKAKILNVMKDTQDASDASALAGVLEEFKCTLTVQANGKYQLSGHMKINSFALGSLLAAKVEQSGSDTADTSEWTLQVRNLFNLTVKSDSKTQTVDTAPDTELPKGAQILKW